jgi:8-oxo-dGTP diphosphatase
MPPAQPFLAQYARPSFTVDIVVLTVRGGALSILLVERGIEPFKGKLALPGGFVQVGVGGVGGEDVDDAAARELVEETGLAPTQVPLVQVRAFGAPYRDPRGRVITAGYLALVKPELAAFVRAGSDAAHAAFHPLTDALLARLAFDHKDIVSATLEFVRRDLEIGTLAFALVPATFTMRELREVHELLGGAPLDPGNFRRKFLRLVSDGIVEPADGTRVTGRRPAQVWRVTRALKASGAPRPRRRRGSPPGR